MATWLLKVQNTLGAKLDLSAAAYQRKDARRDASQMVCGAIRCAGFITPVPRQQSHVVKTHSSCSSASNHLLSASKMIRCAAAARSLGVHQRHTLAVNDVITTHVVI